MAAAFGYDAFGSPLGFDPAAAGTIYLFGGDGVYDAASGLTLHGNGVRARSGFLFLQRDPYAGDRQDPLSLHKYLYVHGDPVSYADPTGMFEFSLAGMAETSLIVGLLTSIFVGVGVTVMGGTQQEIYDAYVQGFLLGAGVGLILYGGAWMISTALAGTYGSNAAYGNLKSAETYGI